MVISKILRLLQVNRPQLRIHTIFAMHIDYANRPESGQEADYVQQEWCEKHLIASSTASSSASIRSESESHSKHTTTGGSGTVPFII